MGLIEKAIGRGIIKDGIMFEFRKDSVKYIVVGLISHDGPLPGTVHDKRSQQVIGLVTDVDLFLRELWES